jgi:hypothetical protein
MMISSKITWKAVGVFVHCWPRSHLTVRLLGYLKPDLAQPATEKAIHRLGKVRDLVDQQHIHFGTLIFIDVLLVFRPQRSTARFCSPRCRKATQRARDRGMPNSVKCVTSSISNVLLVLAMAEEDFAAVLEPDFALDNLRLAGERQRRQQGPKATAALHMIRSS